MIFIALWTRFWRKRFDSAGVLLERAQDPVVARLDAAPYDDEPFTDEERQAVDAALGAPAVPWDEAQAELDR